MIFKIMNLSITEESFVLSTLKEFVKSWAFGSQANFNIESRNSQPRLKLEVQIGHPGDLHHHAPPPPPSTKDLPAEGKIKLELKPTGLNSFNIKSPQILLIQLLLLMPLHPLQQLIQLKNPCHLLTPNQRQK